MRSSLRAVWLMASGVATAAALVGCEAQPGFVAKEWSAAMRKLQVLPVFPPREDIRIGDVFMIPGETREAVEAIESRTAELPDRRTGYLPVPVLIARHDFGSELAKQYGQGPQFQQTPTAALPAGTLYQAQPRRAASFTAGESDRPRLCGMPEFMSATFSSGDLSALVPTEAVSIAAAAGFKQAKVAKLSVPFAEHYALPMTTVWNTLNQTSTMDALRPSLEALFGNVQAGADGTVGYIRVVNEIYLWLGRSTSRCKASRRAVLGSTCVRHCRGPAACAVWNGQAAAIPRRAMVSPRSPPTLWILNSTRSSVPRC